MALADSVSATWMVDSVSTSMAAVAGSLMIESLLQVTAVALAVNGSSVAANMKRVYTFFIVMIELINRMYNVSAPGGSC